MSIDAKVSRMRVIAGAYKGRGLRTVSGLDVRPTSDRLRETVFNILFDKVEGARFLDICSGSGAMAVEALSRGAASATMIEASSRAVRVIRENLRHCAVEPERARVLAQDALLALKTLIRKEVCYDVIYFDPPYKSHLYRSVIELIAGGDLMAKDGLLMVEHSSRAEMPEELGGLRRYRVVRQGESAVSFYERV